MYVSSTDQHLLLTTCDFRYVWTFSGDEDFVLTVDDLNMPVHMQVHAAHKVVGRWLSAIWT
jgi:hypothetical protein